jgi:hypothetical protein
MTRTININAHDLDPAAWTELVADVDAAVAKARKATGGSGINGNVYDSHGDPQNRAL